MRSKQFIAGNAFWLVLERILRLIINLIITASIARKFGTDVFGNYSYALASVLFFVPIIHQSVDKIFTREYVNRAGDRATLLGSVGMTKFLLAWVSYGLLMLFMFIVSSNGEVLALTCILAGSYFSYALRTAESALLAEGDGRSIFFCLILELILSSAVKLVLIYFEASILIISAVYIFETYFAACLVGIRYSRGYHEKIVCNSEAKVVQRILLSSLPLMLASLGSTLIIKSDVIMIGAMLSNGDVAVYVAALNLVLLAGSFGMILIRSALPKVIEIALENNKKLEEFLIALHSLFFYLGVLVSIFVFVVADLVVRIMYGPEYDQSIIFLRYASFLCVFLMLGAAHEPFYIVYNKQRDLSTITLLTAILSIALNLLLIKKFGVLGALLASYITYFSSTIMIPFLFSSTRRLSMITIRSINPINAYSCIKNLG